MTHQISPIKVSFRSRPPLIVTEEDIAVSYFSGGPGGQNVNKNMNGVRMKYVTPEGKNIMSSSIAQREREQNFRKAMESLEKKIRAHFYEPPPRTKTKPTRGSKERRLDTKKRLGMKKASRGKNMIDFP